MCRISGLVTSTLCRYEDDVTGQLTGDVFNRKDVREGRAHFRGNRAFGPAKAYNRNFLVSKSRLKTFR